ncbi:MAG: cytochrome C [Gammaproteobacteria bacterium 28-57-27]|nr:MAG: cytochrome C [Gammaproteobacteria bacterium 28-57-27]
MNIASPATWSAIFGLISALSIAPTQAAVETSAPNAAANTGATFEPPKEDDIPNTPFGNTIRMGRDIMLDTPKHAARFVGNNLSCTNCHLDAGRMAGSAPLWAAYVNYPAYRAKNDKINTYQQRLQGCFRFSMNGSAPPLGDPVLVALEAYSFWLATGLPVNKEVAGRGYPKLDKTTQTPDYARGQAVYTARCALCHGANGAGQSVSGRVVFPALWGDGSYNWGAGMGSIDNAAQFIHANMPYGMSYSLTPQDAWDVAYFMNAHERPQDPRWLGSVEATRTKFHDSTLSLYGQTINGKILGNTGAPKQTQTKDQAHIAP